MGFRQAKGIYADSDKSTSENGVELSVEETTSAQDVIEQIEGEEQQKEQTTETENNKHELPNALKLIEELPKIVESEANETSVTVTKEKKKNTPVPVTKKKT